MLKPKLVDIGRLGSDRFKGSQHLGRGPETLDWFTISGAAALSADVHGQTGRIFGSLSRSELTKSKPKTDNDATYNSSHTQRMNEITREEFNAKLETIEAKMDARVEIVSAKIDGFLAAQAERDKRLDGVLAQIGKDNGETKTSISSMKTTLIVTAVSTVLAIVLGVAGFNTALTSNMLGAFQLGKSASTTYEAVRPEAKNGSPAITSSPTVKSGS